MRTAGNRIDGWFLLLLVAACGGGSATEPAALAGITAAHNAARKAVSPPAVTPIPPLVWSSQVAATAQAWADRCQFVHSGGQYGENLFATTGHSTPEEVVASWVSESAQYDYATNSCSGTCGHYTQVVWAGSLRLGCGVANNCNFGNQNQWQLWVCNYDPPGNFVGEKPY
jgi:uncharacterized protein YkwD